MLYAVISQGYAGKKNNIREKWYGTEYKSTKIDKVCRMRSFFHEIFFVKDILKLH